MQQKEKHQACDADKAEAFAGRLLSALNDGALCLATSIGHRTGLFDAMRDRSPSTVEEIAERAGLQGRYVREWLGAMVTSGVIEVDPTSTRFVLPPEHAAFLTRGAAADNLAVFTQYIAVLGSVENEVVECFQKGGGVPYEKFLRFHAVMAEDSGQSVLSAIESHILPLVPGLTERLSSGIRVLDVGCGSGRIANRLAQRFPKSLFAGIDLSSEAIATARSQAQEQNLTNVAFVAADLSNFDETADAGTYDFITAFDAIHDQARPLNVLKGIYRALKSDGHFLMQDIRGSSSVYNNIGHPLGAFLYTISTMHCMT
ncbi:MAG: methyltransferase domain-containing protein, partial [Proteobacteria bacterium]|nr:methyltransferase domain-containing protein [Pseudomonadota bacterium]